MSNYFFQFVLAICTAGLLTGCRTDFKAISTVREDGSIERITAWIGDNTEDIESFYILPKGGVWSEDEIPSAAGNGEDADKRLAVKYQFLRAYSQKDFPASDYKRYNASKTKMAENRFTVRLRSWWAVKWFEYEERFHDIQNGLEAQKAVKNLFEEGLKTLQAQLSPRLGNPALVEEIIGQLRSKYGPLIDRIVQIIKEAPSPDAILKRMESEFKNENTRDFLETDKIVDFLIEKNPSLASSRWKLKNALENTLTIVEDRAGETVELIFGVHGLPIFDEYGFQIRTRMPGKILKTNAMSREYDQLVWEFDHLSLNHTLYAESRLIYPGRLIILCIFILTAAWTLKILLIRKTE